MRILIPVIFLTLSGFFFSSCIHDDNVKVEATAQTTYIYSDLIATINISPYSTNYEDGEYEIIVDTSKLGTITPKIVSVKNNGIGYFKYYPEKVTFQKKDTIIFGLRNSHRVTDTLILTILPPRGIYKLPDSVSKTGSIYVSPDVYKVNGGWVWNYNINLNGFDTVRNLYIKELRIQNDVPCNYKTGTGENRNIFDSILVGNGNKICTIFPRNFDLTKDTLRKNMEVALYSDYQPGGNTKISVLYNKGINTGEINITGPR
ncbi:MAG TPA: hypothetical protein VHP32_01010 [Ignavibacteria bacterium]|nr:hypothetical protein [Ignavibacteria bacterium]